MWYALHANSSSKTTPSEGERSDYESLASSTASLSSAVFGYEYENGRRYHAYKKGQYYLPNDESEQDRLDMTHHLFLLALKGELCATKFSEPPKRILDIGTGTGIWAIEMGDVYPSAEIIGTDLSPIQASWVPPNVKFEIDDATDEWTFPPNHFDFIHARTMAGSILDWPVFIKQCYTHLKPGGKLEITEGRANLFYAHDSLPKDSYTYKWLMEWRRLSEQVKFDVYPALQPMLEKLPFENIQSLEKLCPMGSWPKDKSLKELGRFFKVQYLEGGLESYTLAIFTRFGGWNEMELKVLIAKVKEEVKTGKMHLYTFL